MSDLDVQLFRYLHDALSGAIMPMIALSVVGGGWGALSVVPLLAWNRTRRFAFALAAVLTTTAVLVFVLKRVFARVRPCNGLPDIHSIAPPTDFSFPSGHAAGSFAFAVFVAIVLVNKGGTGRLLAALLLVLFAIGVGLSRIALGVHYPGDVLAGALLGSAVAAIGARDLIKATANQ